MFKLVQDHIKIPWGERERAEFINELKADIPISIQIKVILLFEPVRIVCRNIRTILTKDVKYLPICIKLFYVYQRFIPTQYVQKNENFCKQDEF